MIKLLIQKLKEDRQKELQRRLYIIRHHITKMFEITKTPKEINIPEWIECKNLMEKLNLKLENPKTINFYYNKIKRNGADVL